MRYTTYIGDGNSSAYRDVRNMYIDEGIAVKNEECVAYLQGLALILITYGKQRIP
ncbi:uncharacterized protein LOC144348608 [Saccoglossus kowalevskii]